ncbi:MAG: hypothetical protein OQK05_10040 [Pseudopelagicola sp.]|nr:hypothetical protein [Pseudopelagicola sp.]
MRTIFKVAAVLTLMAAPVAAQTWSSNAPNVGPVNQPEGMLMHPFPASANHCPNGLQPITMGGVICCGTPNTGETYYNRASYRRAYRGYDCPAGVKGCD